MKKLSLENISYITAFIYTVLIGVAIYISYHINGNPYSSPKLVETLWIFEIVMTLLVVGVGFKYFTKKELGFNKFNKKQSLWLIPIFVILGLMWSPVINFLSENTLTPEKIKLFSLIGFTTLLVGVSEELMYRGIVLGAFIKKKKFISGIFVSSLLFGLLHAVNILGGLTLAEMSTQVAMMFVAGLFFALLRIKIENIIPLMVLHWLYAFVFQSSVLFKVEIDSAFLMIIFEVLFVLIMLPIFIYKNK